MAKIVNRGDRPRMQKAPELPIKITDRKQIARYQRGHSWIWQPSAADLIRIVSASAMTGALSPGFVATSVSHPPDATGVIIMMTLNANTTTSGQVRAMILRDEDGANGQHAALHLSQEMGNNTWRSRIVGPVPFTHGGVYWMTETNGTVNYDIFIDIVGWVLE